MGHDCDDDVPTLAAGVCGVTKLTDAQAPWRLDADITALMTAFPAGEIRFVGGCVRNALLGQSVGDIDLATPLTPDAVIQALDAADIKYVPTGLEHGTITAIIGKKPFEITSLRRDVETDGRRAVIAYTTDWAEDAQRRDLTINALYADSEGHIFDPTGEGLDDIKALRLRFVGDADMRIKEDYLRLLRFFRFLAWYGGEAAVDAEALRACRENRAGLKTLSAERVWKETKALLAAPDPSRALRIMVTNEVLDTLLPEASNAEGVERLVALEAREAMAPDPILRLMAMSARDPLSILRLCRRLKLSKREATRLRGWAEDRAALEAIALEPAGHERARLTTLYESGKTVIMDRARLRAAGDTDPVKSARWMGLADFAARWTPPEFPLRGQDLKAAGVAPGPQMGKMMAALEALWVRSGFEADKDKLLMALTLLNR